MRRKKRGLRALAFLLSAAMLLPMGTTAAAEETSAWDEHLDAVTTFTLADAEGRSVKMEETEIPIEYFRLEGENEQDKEHPCTLAFEEELTYLKGGMIQNSAPATVNNEGGQAHAFSYAHVGNTRVYYMGMLKIYEDDKPRNYIYYTTDTHITNKTVYAVLKEEENEKISLVYNHGTYHTIDYQFQDKDGNPTDDGPDGWTGEQVFGTDRAQAVARNKVQRKCHYPPRLSGDCDGAQERRRHREAFV